MMSIRNLASFKAYLAAAIVALFGLTGDASSAILVVDGGMLKGVRGINIASNSYDVEFSEGSCEALFDDCDTLSDFDFPDMIAATSLLQALFNQALDGTIYDSDPSQIFGCENSSFCGLLVPFALEQNNVTVAQYRNLGGSGADAFNLGSIGTSSDTAGNINTVFVRLETVAPVPLPAGGLLLVTGLAASAIGYRRKVAAKG